MFKFALFLVVAVVSVQGFVPQADKLSNIERLSISEIIQLIIQNIEANINNALVNIKILIEELTKRIQWIIDGIEESIKQIKQRIEEFVEKYGEAAKVCFIQSKPDLELIAQTARGGLTACAQEAHAKLEPVHQDVAFGFEKMMEFQRVVIMRVMKCVQDSQGNAATLHQCLKDQVEPIHSEFEQVHAILVDIAQRSHAAIVEAHEELFQCTKAVHDQVAQLEAEYMQKFSECIADNQ